MNPPPVHGHAALEKHYVNASIFNSKEYVPLNTRAAVSNIFNSPTNRIVLHVMTN